MKQIKIKKSVIIVIILINILSLCSIYYTKLKVKKIETYTNMIEMDYISLGMTELIQANLDDINFNSWSDYDKYHKRYDEYQNMIESDKKSIQKYENKINSIKNRFIDWNMIFEHFKSNIRCSINN